VADFLFPKSYSALLVMDVQRSIVSRHEDNL
jgi:hypothetical protein